MYKYLIFIWLFIAFVTVGKYLTLCDSSEEELKNVSLVKDRILEAASWKIYLAATSLVIICDVVCEFLI